MNKVNTQGAPQVEIDRLQAQSDMFREARDLYFLETKVLQARIDELEAEDEISNALLEDAKAKIAELDELRHHFETKFSEQCQINMRLDAALAELNERVWAEVYDQEFFNRVYEKARAGK